MTENAWRSWCSRNQGGNHSPPEESKEVGAAVISSFMSAYSGLLAPPFLPKESRGCWSIGGLSAALFLSYFSVCYPRGNAKPGRLSGVGLFTRTIGILLLFAVKYISGAATRLRFGGGGSHFIIWLLFLIIAYFYATADNPENGFMLSCLGFAFGVG